MFHFTVLFVLCIYFKMVSNTILPNQVYNSFQNESASLDWKYNKTDSFSFEIINIDGWRDFVLENRAWAYYAAGIYVVTIFGIQKFMKNRPAFDLKIPLIAWNAALGIFSIMGFLRTFPNVSEHLTGLEEIYEGVCVRQFTAPALGFWGITFVFSKYVELGDTLFIVLRKRPLQLLQWYHHITALIVVWVMLPYNEPIAATLMVVNYGVHSVMYPYFALKMAGFDVPKSIANVITTAQFAQMVIAFILNAVTKVLLAWGLPCYRTSDSILVVAVVFGSYVILFGRLFHNNVLKRWSKAENQHTKKSI